MLQSDVHDQLHFIMSQHLTGRIARVDNADCSGLIGDNAFNFFSYGILIAVVCSGWNCNHLAASLAYEGLVVGVERFCHDDFIVIVQNCSHQHVDGFRSAVGDEQILLFEVQTDSLIVPNQSFQQTCFTLGISVSQNFLVEILHGIKESLRCLDIRLAQI